MNIKLSLFMMLLAFPVLSCTSGHGGNATISIQLPTTNAAPSSLKAKSTGATANTSNSIWGESTPTSFSSVNCFAVLISGPETSLQGNKCYDDSGAVVANAGLYQFAAAAGSSISLDMPSGPQRKIMLLGMASSNGSCTDFAKSGSIDFQNLSEPLIIGSTTQDIVPGPQSVDIYASFTDAQSIARCDFMPNSTPNPSPGPTPIPTRTFSNFQPAVLSLPIMSNAPGLWVTATKIFAVSAIQGVYVFNAIPTISNVAPSFVLGQPSGPNNLISVFNGSALGQFTQPSGAAVYGNTLFVADKGNSRVVLYNTTGLNVSSPASLAITTPVASMCSAQFLPSSVFVTPAGRLIVIDENNNQVYIWNSASSAIAGLYADLVIGNSLCIPTPTDLTRFGASAVWSDDQRLIITDPSNNRVLIWNTFPLASHTPADFVLGQVNGTSSVAQGGASGLSGPVGVTSDGVKLFVSDAANNRILIWNSFPSTYGAPADVVLGQPNMSSYAAGTGSSSLNSPGPLFYFNNQLWASDENNTRILTF